MLIGELSETAGVPIDTIRFYEKRGLLNDKHFCRKDNNYRDYTETAVARLELIRQGQMIGLTLAEIARFIEAWETDALTTQQKIAFFEYKLEQVDEKIAALEQTKDYIRAKIAMLCVTSGPEISSAGQRASMVSHPAAESESLEKNAGGALERAPG